MLVVVSVLGRQKMAHTKGGDIMLKERYFDREWRIEDIEKRGGTFVHKDVLEKNLSGSLCEGTLHYGNGKTADLIVKYRPFGGGRVIGPARKTPAGYKQYLGVMEAFEALEKDQEYALHATKRQLIAAAFNLLMIVFMISGTIDILLMDLSNPLPTAISVGVKFLSFLAAGCVGMFCRKF